MNNFKCNHLMKVWRVNVVNSNSLFVTAVAMLATANVITQFSSTQSYPSMTVVADWACDWMTQTIRTGIDWLLPKYKQTSHGLYGSAGSKMAIHAHFFRLVISTHEVGQSYLVFGMRSWFISWPVQARLQVCVQWLQFMPVWLTFIHTDTQTAFD